MSVIVDDEPEYEDNPTPTELVIARRIAKEADLAGWTAAGETIWIG